MPPLAAGQQRVVTGKLRPVDGAGVTVQAVQEDPGGGIAGDPELVVVVEVAAQDAHAVGDQQAGPGVVQG
jgi:hypothetical protein